MHGGWNGIYRMTAQTNFPTSWIISPPPRNLWNGATVTSYAVERFVWLAIMHACLAVYIQHIKWALADMVKCTPFRIKIKLFSIGRISIFSPENYYILNCYKLSKTPSSILTFFLNESTTARGGRTPNPRKFLPWRHFKSVNQVIRPDFVCVFDILYSFCNFQRISSLIAF